MFVFEKAFEFDKAHTVDAPRYIAERTVQLKNAEDPILIQAGRLIL
jgi:hypothetical protein